MCTIDTSGFFIKIDPDFPGQFGIDFDVHPKKNSLILQRVKFFRKLFFDD